jgi:PPE-repeat protein
MDYALLPPEVNSARIYSGPGSAPMLAAAAAWDGLAVDLESTAASYQSAISELTSGPWLGPSSSAMVAAATPYATWMRTTATQAARSATQARMAAGAYETVFAMTVPPLVIAANRTLLMSLIATNLFGQNTAAIAATEAHYMEMWAQDALAMYGYAGQSATASALAPFAPAPHTTNAAGLAGQGGALAQSTAGSAGTGAQTLASMGSQPLSAVPATLQALAQPAQGGILDLLGFTSLQSFLALGNLLAPYNMAAATVNMGINTTHHAHWPAVGGAAVEAGSGAGSLVSAAPVGLGGSAVSGSVGQANAVGRLSVPSGWTVAAPEVRTVARVLPMAGASAAAAPLTGTSGTLFSEMALAGMAGRAMGVGGVGRQQCADADGSQRVRPPQDGPWSDNEHRGRVAEAGRTAYRQSPDRRRIPPAEAAAARSLNPGLPIARDVTTYDRHLRVTPCREPPRSSLARRVSPRG